MITLNKQVINTQQFGLPEQFFNFESFSKNITKINEVVWYYENDTSIIELLMFTQLLYQESLLSDEYKLVISYLPYSRADRKIKNKPFGLQVIHELLNLQYFQVYSEIKVVEPHSKAADNLVYGNLFNRTIPKLTTPILLSIYLSELNLKSGDYVVVYPDAGAEKRYKYVKTTNKFNLVSPTIPTITMKKHRNEFGKIDSLEIDHYSSPELELNIKDNSIKHAIIIDDLCSYGGTFIRTAKKLKELGLNKLTLIVTHLEPAAYIPVHENSVFNIYDHVVSSNSLIANPKTAPILADNHKVFSIERLI